SCRPADLGAEPRRGGPAAHPPIRAGVRVHERSRGGVRRVLSDDSRTGRHADRAHASPRPECRRRRVRGQASSPRVRGRARAEYRKRAAAPSQTSERSAEMIDAWFAPDVARWFAFLSLFSLLAVCAPLVQRGSYKALVVSSYAGAAGLGLVLLGLAAI